MLKPEKYIDDALLVGVDHLADLLNDWYQGKVMPGIDNAQSLAIPVFGHKPGVVRYHRVAPREQGAYILFDEGPHREMVRWKYKSYLTMLQRAGPRAVLLVNIAEADTMILRRVLHENQDRFYALIAAAQLNKAVDPFDPFDL